jgi:hypothetical protein
LLGLLSFSFLFNLIIYTCHRVAALVRQFIIPVILMAFIFELTCTLDGEPVKKNWTKEALLGNFVLIPNELQIQTVWALHGLME